MRVFHFGGEKTIARCVNRNIEQFERRGIYRLLTTYISGGHPDNIGVFSLSTNVCAQCFFHKWRQSMYIRHGFTKHVNNFQSNSNVANYRC